MPPHINVFNVVSMLYHEFSVNGIKLSDFKEADVDVKNKITGILNKPDSICDMFKDEAQGTLDFELPVDEYDLENSVFGINEINETFADK